MLNEARGYSTSVTFAYIASFLVHSWAIFRINQENHSLSKSIFVAIPMGTATGLSLRLAAADEGKAAIDWYSVVDNGYVSLLKLVTVPLIFIPILLAINKSENSADIRKVSLTVVGCILCLVVIAGFIGLLIVHVLDPDASALIHMQSTLIVDDVSKIAAISLPKLVTSLIPANIFLNLTGTRSASVIGTAIFILLAGVTLLKVKQNALQEGKELSTGVNAIQIWVTKVVRIAITPTPYGVMALMADVFSSYRFEQFASLLDFIAAYYLAILIIFIVHVLILVLSGNNPVHYFKTVWLVLTFASISRSSAASIPLATPAQEKFDMQNTTTNITTLFGSSMGQNGYAGTYPAIMVVMIAPTIGIDPLSVHFPLVMLPTIALDSIGTAGAGDGGTFAALIILSALNFPVALAGIFIVIEPVVDMTRTALDVNGSIMSGVLINRLPKESTEKPQPVNAS